MNDLRVPCPKCGKTIEVSKDDVKRSRVDKASKKRLVIVRTTCPHCEQPVQCSLLD